MPGRRLFVALPLPSTAVDAVSELVATVRAEALPAGMHDVRWVRLDGLHLTLRFLGPTLDERIGPTIDAVRRAARAASPIDAVMAGTGTFPAHGRPRTLWIGLPTGDVEIAQAGRGHQRGARRGRLATRRPTVPRPPDPGPIGRAGRRLARGRSARRCAR